MRTLQARSRSGQVSQEGYPGRWEDDGDRLSDEGLPVTEEEYWEKYYNDPDFIYEWKNGYLEVRPVSDQKGCETYYWFCDILRCYVRTHQAGRMSGQEIGFRMDLPGEVVIRRPDMAVILNDNPVEIDDDDCTYKGIFDLCVESLSHSSKKEVERDTVAKKGEYRGGGVREYYILDARKIETAFYQMNAKGQYRKISRKGGIVRSGILPGFQFRVSDLYLKPPLEELAEDPVYRDYVFPSFMEVRKELALEKKRAEKAEKSLVSEKQRAEKEKQRAEKEKQRAEQSENRFIEAARAMLSGGLDTAAVIKYTGLAADEIASLQRDV